MTGPALADLWVWHDPVTSERRFRDLAQREPGLRLAASTQVARALGLQERYGDAHAVLDEVARSDDGTDPEVAVRVSLERGRLVRSAGRPEDAVPLFAEAAARAAAALPADEDLEELYVDALHMLALDGSPWQRLERTRAALDVARAARTPGGRRWDASLLNNLGVAQQETGDLDGALASFEAALALREERGQVREARVARWMVGWALRHLGRVADAVVVQRALKAELEAAGEEDPYVDEELALLAAEQVSGDGTPGR
ncbi:MAG TPA: tetratricopeptide repeat protein [Nocardioides sp.]|nr:tetratricopeptide repeat protein [Nocardioides sp.]